MTGQNVTNEIKSGQRNYGVDLLRIVSMVMICVLHTLGHGGILNSFNDTISANREIAWLLEICCYCGVNCYALISGYVGRTAKYKFSNLIYLLLQVLFYTLLTTVIFSIVQKDFSFSSILIAFLPVIFNTYWYFTCYFALFLLMPLLNFIINGMERTHFRNTLLIITIIVSICNMYNGSVFEMNSGYSVLWLSILYLIGGYVSKYQPFCNVQVKTLILGWAGMILLTWLSKICIEFVTMKVLSKVMFSMLFIRYFSLNILFISVVLLEFFSRMKIKHHKTISIFAPLTFGVYLIHENPYMRTNFITNRFTSYADMNPFLMLICVIGTACGIYLVCSAIDFIRLQIFNLLTIKTLLVNLENKIREKRKIK